MDDTAFCDRDHDLGLADLERPAGGWDEAPTAKVAYERRSCGMVRVSVTRLTRQDAIEDSDGGARGLRTP